VTGAQPPGTVALVGAGPGDPGLITRRGAELLRGASAVVVDALAAPQLLALCDPGAVVHDAGKRAGRQAMTQAAINALLVDLARGGHRVVRLKGGDPFVFGRGGEECAALREAGVDYEVVPGVSSAIAAPAAAGIPVTHRDWASHVTIVTGHERDDEADPRVDHAALAALLPGGTLIFLMGARSLPRLAVGLLAAGADPATPAAAVQWATDPRQRQVVASLDSIATAVAAAGMGAPLVTVVGRVAALAEGLAWSKPAALQGRRILVTRARAQASGLLERLRDLGADAVELPVIEVEAVAEAGDVLQGLLRLAQPRPGGRLAVFTSANAVRLVLAALRDSAHDVRVLSGVTLVAIGPETAAAVAEAGLRADLVPTEYVSEAVAELLIAQGVAGAYVWLPRAAQARDVVPDRLRAAGAEVVVTPIYRSVLPSGTVERLREELARAPVDAVTFTSSSTVAHFQTALAGAEFPAGAIAACIGPVTARSAAAAGFPVGLVAESSTTDELAEALVRHFSVP
jgi:uroporphyrinogen III methyltransferase/synthase